MPRSVASRRSCQTSSGCRPARPAEPDSRSPSPWWHYRPSIGSSPRSPPAMRWSPSRMRSARCIPLPGPGSRSRAVRRSLPSGLILPGSSRRSIRVSCWCGLCPAGWHWRSRPVPALSSARPASRSAIRPDRAWRATATPTRSPTAPCFGRRHFHGPRA